MFEGYKRKFWSLERKNMLRWMGMVGERILPLYGDIESQKLL